MFSSVGVYPYNEGFRDRQKESEKELQELREYKSKVEKFISEYDGAMIISKNLNTICGQTLIDELKWRINYETKV